LSVSVRFRATHLGGQRADQGHNRPIAWGGARASS
jgi:hypothetical protein